MKYWLGISFILFVTVGFSQTINEKATVTMKEYVDMQASLNKEWTQKLVEVQFQNINDNVNKANAAMEKRLDGINEFRAQLKDQAGTFVTRDALWGWMLAIAGFVLAFMNYQRGKNQNSSKNIQSGDQVKVEK